MRRALGGSYRSTLLHGSVAMGDFQPGWSDVDVCVVRDDLETDEQVRRLAALQRETDARFLDPHTDTWVSGQTIDPLFVHVDEVEGRRASHVGAFDLLSLSTRTVLMDGDPVSIPRPSRRDLLRRLKSLLEEAGHPPKGASSIWYAAMIHLLARALAFWRDEELVSKSEALKREIANGGSQAHAFALALEIRRSGSASAAAYDRELREAFAAVAGPGLAQLTAICRS